VRQAIAFAAACRMHTKLSSADVKQKIDTIIQLAGLSEAQNNVVGDALNRGISGGQLRRLTVSVGFTIIPFVLILDEPTNGLDAVNAFSVCLSSFSFLSISCKRMID